MKRLDNKVCAITGAGRGIGRAAAERFASEGARVLILELDEETGVETETVINRAGGEAEYVHTDVSDAESVKTCFAHIRERYGRLDVLYNNASIYLAGEDARVTDLDPEIWSRILAINLGGVFHCCKYAIPLMIEGGGGSVINTSSSAGIIAIPGNDAYTATKGATIALTRSLAVEYGPANVRVNCIAPAAVLTPMMRQASPEKSDDFDEEDFLHRRAPLRRYGRPEEIAAVALFLASDDAAYLNGAIITADGGVTINGDLSRRG